MVRENTFGKTVLTIKVNSKMDLEKVQVNGIIQRKHIMKDNLKTTLNMEKENRYFKMEINIKDNFLKMLKLMDNLNSLQLEK